MHTVNLSAYAKINLFLDITGRRENGYHEIDGVMQTVDLCDEITMTVESGEGIEVVCDSAYAPDGKENIVYRAAEKYLIANDIEASVKIALTKNIPAPAGMRRKLWRLPRASCAWALPPPLPTAARNSPPCS